MRCPSIRMRCWRCFRTIVGAHAKQKMTDSTIVQNAVPYSTIWNSWRNNSCYTLHNDQLTSTITLKAKTASKKLSFLFEMWVVENRRGGDSLQLAVFETAVARCRRQEPPEFTMSATNNFLDSVGLESIVQCRLKFVAPNNLLVTTRKPAC
jgi:hypothetical protein